MAATTFLRTAIPEDRLAHGYVRRDEQWVPEPMDEYGALAAMGGLFTTIGDLARWVAGLIDAFPARDDPEGGHPLCRASRREMQQVHRAFAPQLALYDAEYRPTLTAGGYGLGLFVQHDLEIGTVVGHGGGYPGFGSTMRWHPGSGLGVIGLANARYARASRTGSEALRHLVRAEAAPVRRVRAAPSTERLRAAAERLLAAWDDGLADEVFALNMDLDEPRERRRAAFLQARQSLGRLVPDDEAPANSSPAQLSWWLRGERGRVRVDLLATGEAVPRIQGLELTVVPDPMPSLAALAAQVAGLLDPEDPRWPEELPLAAATDAATMTRSLRAARLLLGPVALGRPVGGDGERSATFAVSGVRGHGELRLEIDEAGAVRGAAVVPAPLAAPPEAP
jgi:hypothetical protein